MTTAISDNLAAQHFVTYYDIATFRQPQLDSSDGVMIALLVVCAWFMVAGVSPPYSFFGRLARPILAIAAPLFGLYVYLTPIPPPSDYLQLRAAEASGHFQVVEGVVTNFHRQPSGGHDTERFTVGGVDFALSDYVMTAAFHQSASHGSPLRAGVRVRISYVPDQHSHDRWIQNQIIRLEIADR